MKRAMSLVVAVAATALLAGCASAAGPAETATDGPVTVKVGVLPINNLAPLYIGIEQGWFAEVGLTVDPVVQPGGAQIVAALVSGDLDIGWSATPGTVIAASQGVPIKVVAPGVVAPEDGSALSGQPVVVGADSPIQGIADLAGKTIAVNTRGNILDITISATLDANGVDPATVNFVEIPFPDMPAALAGGQVDAVAAAEPFFSQLAASGARPLFDAFAEAAPGLPTGHWVSTASYAEKNPSAVARFAQVIARANVYANDNPDAARAAIGTYTKIPPDVIAAIRLAPWSGEIDPEGLQRIADLTREYGPTGLPSLDVSTILLQ